MEITLTPDIEQALMEQAREQGISPEQLALESLRRQFVQAPHSNSMAAPEGTLADFLGDSIGVLRSSEYVSGGARLSENPGKAFVEGLHKKRQQGRL